MEKKILTIAELLRQKAEEILKNKSKNEVVDLLDIEIKCIVHELEVHQIELEMQFDELSAAHKIISEAKQEYNDLFDYAPFGYLALDKEGIIKKLNFNAASLLGKERIYLTKKTFALFVTRETLDVFILFLHDVFTNPGKHSCELVIKSEQPEPLYVLMEGASQSNSPECLLTMIDISGRKQRERTIELQNRALQELNATKDKFFSIIAHDLQNPIVSILGFSQMLSSQAQEMGITRVRQLAGYINASTVKTHELMENLFDWARLQTGKLVPHPASVNLTDLIHEVVEQCVPIAAIKTIELKTAIEKEIILQADKEMTKAVLRNLITNGIKFTHPCGIIHIKLAASRDVAVFSVSDTGIGMDQIQIDKLFRIDKMISQAGTANEKGSGLGLILCKEFVEKQGGAIHVKSERGKGSEFSFTLPID